MTGSLYLSLPKNGFGFSDIYAILMYVSGDQENQSLLIHITGHLNRRGRVRVCGGNCTSASLESSLLYLLMEG